MSTTIRVPKKVRDLLVAKVGELQMALKRPLSMADAIVHVLKETESYRRMPLYADVDGVFECRLNAVPRFVDALLRRSGARRAVVSGFLSTADAFPLVGPMLTARLRDLGFEIEGCRATTAYSRRRWTLLGPTSR